MERRTENLITLLFSILTAVAFILFSACIYFQTAEKACEKEICRENKAPAVLIESAFIFEEDPLEEQHTKAAVISTIGTEQEEEAFGYDFDFVCRTVMAEAGSNSDDLQTAVATCIYNAYIKEGLRFSPEEICHEYGYTEPALAASDRVIQNTLDVLYLGNVNSSVEDALYFYSPLHCSSEWHEKQTFITEIDGVRFFK